MSAMRQPARVRTSCSSAAAVVAPKTRRTWARRRWSVAVCRTSSIAERRPPGPGTGRAVGVHIADLVRGRGAQSSADRGDQRRRRRSAPGGRGGCNRGRDSRHRDARRRRAGSRPPARARAAAASRRARLMPSSPPAPGSPPIPRRAPARPRGGTGGSAPSWRGAGSALIAFRVTGPSGRTGSTATETQFGVLRVGPALAGDAHDPDHRALVAAMVEEGLVAGLHRPQMEPGGVVADPVPFGAAVADEIVPAVACRARISSANGPSRASFRRAA